MNIKKIVAGIDFNKSSLPAAKWAMTHFAPDADYMLLHVLDVPVVPFFWRRAVPDQDEVVKKNKAELLARLSEVVSELPSKAIKQDVVVGKPSELITEVAKKTKADLILIGGSDDGEVRWEGLTSTAERLAGRSSVPILVVRNFSDKPIKRVLVGVDESDEAIRALDWATMLAAEHKADLVVSHIMSSSLFANVERCYDRKQAEEVGVELEQESRAWIKQLIASAKFQVKQVSIDICFGRPSSSLVEAAERAKADLIVMGTQGAGAVRGILLGRATKNVLANAHCPVLMIPEKKTEQ